MKCRQHLLVVMISVALGACSSEMTAPQMAMPDVDQVRSANLRWNNDLSLSALQQLTSKGTQEALKERVLAGEGSRYRALKETAYELGIRASLYQRRKSLNSVLGKTQVQLNKIFDFSQYMLPGNVFPPVITETNGMVQKNGRTEIRSVRHSYHILTMPALLIEPPTYLNYLVRHYPAPEMPDGLRMPTNEVESKNWGIWVQEGWEIGKQQAELQYQADLKRLERDLKGIRLFHDLVAKGVVSMPRLAKQDFGVVKSKDGRTLSIGDEVMSIIIDSSFTGSDQWVPIIGERIDE